MPKLSQAKVVVMRWLTLSAHKFSVAERIKIIIRYREPCATFKPDVTRIVAVLFYVLFDFSFIPRLAIDQWQNAGRVMDAIKAKECLIHRALCERHYFTFFFFNLFISIGSKNSGKSRSVRT